MALSELPPGKPIILSNVTCPYCGVDVANDTYTKEHVIGRRFVPKGTLDRQWNLIVRACSKCNTAKSDMEDDISAITLAEHLWFDSTKSAKSEREETRRKIENSISRKTKKPVRHSQEELNLNIPFARGVTLQFGLVAPPQSDDDRVFKLARMQMMAFFYWITFDRATRMGGFWPGWFYAVSKANHSDWGNVVQRAFMNAVTKWEPRLVGNTASGFFRTIIRRHPREECWSWALEWNKSYRLIGFFGERDPAQAVVNTFPRLEMKPVSADANSSVRIRQEVRLLDEDDVLFA